MGGSPRNVPDQIGNAVLEDDQVRPLRPQVQQCVTAARLLAVMAVGERVGQRQRVHIHHPRLQARLLQPSQPPPHEVPLAGDQQHPDFLGVRGPQDRPIQDDVFHVEGQMPLGFEGQGLQQLIGFHRGHFNHPHDHPLPADREVDGLHRQAQMLHRLGHGRHDAPIINGIVERDHPRSQERAGA